MQTETQKAAIEQKVTGLLDGDPTHFLVEVRIKPTNNIKVFIDGDEGVNISLLAGYNRRLYKILEESGFFPADDFSLEVSSPGLDEPLKLHRQYKKNIGRYVEVLLTDATRKEGKLIDATEDRIVIEQETGKGKKAQTIQESLLFDTIKSTKIQTKW